jgi:hypothetical protein
MSSRRFCGFTKTHKMALTLEAWRRATSRRWTLSEK